MKRTIFLVTTCACLGSFPAFAADKVLVAPTPGWVAPAPAIDTATPGTILPHFDEQVRINGDVVTIYIETARQLTSPEQLSQAGTLSYNWQPAHGDITFHRVEILRGGKTIDVLEGGKGFSVLQRESGLERRMVDGSLTAVKHIEGLAVGDVLHITLSTEDGVPPARTGEIDTFAVEPVAALSLRVSFHRRAASRITPTRVMA